MTTDTEIPASAPQLIACECCDALYTRVDLTPRDEAHCPACGSSLYHGLSLGISALFALVLTGVVCAVIALWFPLFAFTLGADTREANLFEIVAITYEMGYVTVAGLTLMTVLVLPGAQLLAWMMVLGPLNRGERSADFASAMHTLRMVRPWAMVEVFLIGIAVSGSKMMQEGEVIIGPGLAGLTVLTLILALLKLQDLRAVWDAAYGPNIVADDRGVALTRQVSR